MWLEGDISGKVTVAAADVDTSGKDPTIVLNNNIVYTDDTSGLLAIAEQDVLVGLVVPDDMELNGIFVAQNGRFGRNNYKASWLPQVCTAYWWFLCLNWDALFDEYIKRNSLTMYGTIVSNSRVGTKWINTSTGAWLSGFNTRYNSYDRDLVADPPPMTPEVSDTYSIIEWREVE